MADWENTVFPKGQKVPCLYFRYLDDIFGIWNHSKEDFSQFLDTLNGHHKTIKLKANIQTKQTEFLDTEVYFIKKN